MRRRVGPPGADPPTEASAGGVHYSSALPLLLRRYNAAAFAMTSEQAAQLIDDTLDLVHQRQTADQH
jgi:hypothetical protein